MARIRTFHGFQMRCTLLVKPFQSICESFRFGEGSLQPGIGRGPEALVNGNTIVLTDLQLSPIQNPKPDSRGTHIA